MDNILEKLNVISTAAKDVLNGFKYKFNIESTASIVDVNNDSFAQKFIAEQQLKNKKPNDFIILKNYLVTSLPYINGNGDAFKPEDLEKVLKDGQLSTLQPAIIDWHHDFMPRGNTIGGEIVEKEIEIAGLGKQKVKQIVVYSVFYAWLFPYEGEKIRKWAKDGILRFSMACGADDIEWINGNNRVLINPHFVANSIIPPDADPADENAKLIKIANKTLGEDMDKIKELEDKIKNLETTLAQKDNTINELKKTELSKENEKLVAEKKELEDKLKAIEDEKQALSAEKEKIEKELNTKVDALTASIDELKKGNKELSDKLIEINKNEVEKINASRKEELGKYISDEEKLGKWYEKYEAKLSETGDIVAENGYDEFISLLAEASKNEVDESDVVTASKKVVPPNNKTNEKLFKSWA